MVFDAIQREHLAPYLPPSITLEFLEREFDKANSRYRKDTKGIYNGKYSGDFGCGLLFVMMTYNPSMWLDYFNDTDVTIG